MMNDVYEKFLKSSEEFIFAENTSRKNLILFLYREMVIRKWRKMCSRLFKKGMAEWILPSGRYSVVNGKFSGVLEKAMFIIRIWNRMGISQGCSYKKRCSGSKILKEDQATLRMRNAIYSRQVTDHAELEIERAILCCKSYHSRRCLMYYQLLYTRKHNFMWCLWMQMESPEKTGERVKKELMSVTGELSRIVKQFSLMLER